MLSANEDLLPTLRTGGPFDISKLERFREELLRYIAAWFHEIHEERLQPQSKVIDEFLKLLRKSENPAVISFNWDYELDKALFGGHGTSGALSREGYGLQSGDLTTPVLLKPHGSLNWYPSPSGKHISGELRFRLWKPTGSEKSMYCFSTLAGRALDTGPSIRTVDCAPDPLETLRASNDAAYLEKVCGRSEHGSSGLFSWLFASPADWHSRYIVRCGFHNQIRIPHGYLHLKVPFFVAWPGISRDVDCCRTKPKHTRNDGNGSRHQVQGDF